MTFDWNKVPGYREAVARDTQELEEAFLGAPESICGVAVKPLTLRHIQILRALKSPFFTSGDTAYTDVAIFMWVVSTKFREIDSHWDRWVHSRFIKSLRKLVFVSAVEECHEYLSLSFRDSPGSTSHPSESFWSLSASLTDLVASEYGWPYLEVINTPICQLFQLMKVMRNRHNPDAVAFSHHASKVKTAYRRQRDERIRCQTKV